MWGEPVDAELDGSVQQMKERLAWKGGWLQGCRKQPFVNRAQTEQYEGHLTIVQRASNSAVRRTSPGLLHLINHGGNHGEVSF